MKLIYADTQEPVMRGDIARTLFNEPVKVLNWVTGRFSVRVMCEYENGTVKGLDPDAVGMIVVD